VANNGPATPSAGETTIPTPIPLYPTCVQRPSQTTVAAVFVTALAGFVLAGFVLAGEALKAGGGEAFVPYRLGVPGQLGTKHEESLFHSPNTSLVAPARRHEGSACLCRSPRRLRIMRQRYGLAEEVA
jgi:hypothetical protein